MNSPLSKYIILSFLLLLLAEIFNKELHFKELLYNSLSENLTNQQIENFIGLEKKWKWINYILIPAFLFIKSIIITSVLYIGVFFKINEFSFKLIWNVVLKAEFIFLLVPIFKICWFVFFQTDYNLNDVQNFYPLSALNITGYKNLEVWFIYPFQLINLFELSYIIYLGFQIGKLTNTNADYGLKIVAISYVPALLLWVATVMFFTLNYS